MPSQAASASQLSHLTRVSAEAETAGQRDDMFSKFCAGKPAGRSVSLITVTLPKKSPPQEERTHIKRHLDPCSQELYQFGNSRETSTVRY